MIIINFSCLPRKELLLASEERLRELFVDPSILISMTSLCIADAPENTPDNPAVKKSLIAMLTLYVTRKFSKEEPHEVCSLGIVYNSPFNYISLENAYFWNEPPHHAIASESISYIAAQDVRVFQWNAALSVTNTRTFVCCRLFWYRIFWFPIVFYTSKESCLLFGFCGRIHPFLSSWLLFALHSLIVFFWLYWTTIYINLLIVKCYPG